jgi:hypothetical protein
MGQNVNLNQKFLEYFNEIENYGMRSERFYADLESQRHKEDSVLIVTWLKAAFISGARTMAQDTLDTLGDYGTAVAGINEVCYNRTQAFDSARINLMTYYTTVLDETANENKI